jgi:hypothetical protein
LLAWGYLGKKIYGVAYMKLKVEHESVGKLFFHNRETNNTSAE